MKPENPKYRFPGLNSFGEDDKEIFKGRQKESANLYAKILLYKTVVLHANSGTGKSSLIQAGLLPLLKKSEENYFPVILQFNEIVHGDSVSLLTDFALKKIEDNIRDSKINTTSIDILDGHKNSLWKYSKILEKATKKLLLIFDQFENLQTFKLQQVDHFVEELYNLINPKIPSNVFESIETQFSSIVDEKSDTFNRVNQSYLFLSKPSVANLLFVIREDKLGVMSLLSDYFPDILKNDFRIEPLSIDYAKEALEIPAGYIDSEFKSAPFSFEDPAYVINKIADEDTGLIDPILLQIVASSIEINEVMVKGKLIITNKDIPEVSNIVTKYYNDSLDEIGKDLNFTELQISEYKKNTLSKFVINERRTLVDSESIQTSHIKFIKALVDKGLIREIPAEKKAIYYQLVHDRMIGPIINDPKITKANSFEKYLKSIKIANKVAIISMVPLVLTLFYVESSYFNYSAQFEKLDTELYSLQKKYKESSDSISMINTPIVINDTLSNNSTKSNLISKFQKLNNKRNQDSLSFSKYSKELKFLEKYSPPSIKIVITIVNILFWGLLVFFQFARRISLKYLFKEIHNYKTKKNNNNDESINLLLPLWLSPVSKTNFILLSSIKPVNIFNNTRTGFLNFIAILCLLVIIIIQFHLTYISYIFRDENSDIIFYLNVLFSLFSMVAAAFWFTPLYNKEYADEKENSKTLSRKDFIVISIYSILTFTLFKLKPTLPKKQKPRFLGTNPRYGAKKPKPKFDLPDYKSQIVINRKSKIVHFFDDKGFSLVLKSIQTEKNFIQFKHNIEIFKELDKLAIKGLPRMAIIDLSWNTENIALDSFKSGNIEMAAKILLYGIRQNYKSSLRLTDLLVLICIRHNAKVPKDALDQLINYSAISEDKKLIERVEKWRNLNWRNKIMKATKVVFNKTEI